MSPDRWRLGRAPYTCRAGASWVRPMTLIVRDDGVGGAYPGGGSGLVGLQDRLEALGGTIKIDSSARSGTCVVATLPIA